MLNDGQRRRNVFINLAIGIILAASILPCLGRLLAPTNLTARTQAQYLTSLNNIKNLALAVHNFATMNKDTLPANITGAEARSWRVEILQYLDRADLHRAYDRDAAWNTPENQEITKANLKVFDAPAGGRDERTANGFAISDYGMISGPGTVHPDDHVVTLDEISEGDGLGQTLLLGECIGLRLAWAEPRDPRVDREIIGIETLTRTDQTSNKLLSSYTQGGAPVAFADGSARILNAKLDPRILQALCTVDGDEGINQSDYVE